MKKIFILITLILIMAAVVLAEESQVIPAGVIQQEIIDYVAKNAGCAQNDLLIEYKTPLADEKIPSGRAAIEIKSGANAKFLGFTTLEVYILLDEKVYKSFIVYLEIDIKTKAYMASRWIKRYEYLGPDNVNIVDTYRSKIPMNALSVDEDLAGKVAKAAIAKGRIITGSGIELPPLVRSRDPVNVIMESKNIQISAKGVALMDGRKDEVIKLRLLDSKKDIYGKVVDAATVAVETGR